MNNFNENNFVQENMRPNYIDYEKLQPESSENKLDRSTSIEDLRKQVDEEKESIEKKSVENSNENYNNEDLVENEVEEEIESFEVMNNNDDEDSNIKIVNSTFYITYAFLITTGTITFIEALRTKDPSIRNILNLETCISIVAFLEFFFT